MEANGGGDFVGTAPYYHFSDGDHEPPEDWSSPTFDARTSC